MQTDNLHINHLLLERVAAGEETAFAELLVIIVPKLQAVVFKLVKDQDTVDEIMQETFIRIWMNRDKLPDIEKPEAWLKRVALNETFTWLHKNALRAKVFGALPEDNYPDTNNADERIQLRETQTLLQKAIDDMPAQRKKIYLMSRAEGMKPDDIAAELGVSAGYVKNALTAALDHLRDRLKSAGRWIWFWL